LVFKLQTPGNNPEEAYDFINLVCRPHIISLSVLATIDVRNYVNNGTLFLISLLVFRHLVTLLGRGIRKSSGIYLHRAARSTETHNMQAHSSIFIQNSATNSEVVEDGARLRPVATAVSKIVKHLIIYRRILINNAKQNNNILFAPNNINQMIFITANLWGY
jgi:hypothetical protein